MHVPPFRHARVGGKMLLEIRDAFAPAPPLPKFVAAMVWGKSLREIKGRGPVVVRGAMGGEKKCMSPESEGR